MSDKEKTEALKPEDIGQMVDHKPNEDALRMLLKQNWDQVKHLRSIMMWFTELYIGVIVGAVALLGSAEFKNQSFLLIFFLIVAVLGLLITRRMDIRIKGRSNIMKDVMQELNLRDYILPSKGIFTWRLCLILFYFVMCIIWVLFAVLQMYNLS
jgi:hypothetical protein